MSLTLTHPFTVVDAAQRSSAWFEARLGRLTGSKAAAMLASRQDKEEAAARRDLRAALVVERLTGQVQDDGYVSPEMRRAIAVEPLAVAAYEARTGHVVQRTGFLSHDTLPVGCSLDGHLGDFAGILEIKCPKSATHLTYLREGTVPPAYLPQIVHNLWISGAAWCDFLSFDDRFPPHLQTVCVRYHRNEQEIALYTVAVARFLDEIGDEVASLEALKEVA